MTPEQFEKNGGAAEDVIGNYSFGLSTLHLWIRSFEFLLKVSYRLDLQEKKLTADEKQQLTARKKEIQKEFKESLGLRVDQPRQGFGNTNDGNMARAFFRQSAKSAEITGLVGEIIIRTILKALSSIAEMDPDAYELYVRETKMISAQYYPWYSLTPTMHKLLDHGPSIVRHFRRPTSRLHNIFDLLSMLLTSSDPKVNSLRGGELRKAKGVLDVDLLPSMRIDPCSEFNQDDYSTEEELESSSSDSE